MLGRLWLYRRLATLISHAARASGFDATAPNEAATDKRCAGCHGLRREFAERRMLTLAATVALALVASCDRPTPVVFADFSEALGVKSGTPVIYRGIEVGKVKSITLERTKARVAIAITQADAPLRSTDRVEIVPVGMFGDVALRIVPTGDQGQPVTPGMVLRGDSSHHLPRP